ncbi:MAG: hypothetical protein H0U76_27200, partial [Ktedonobacteraceae bacterium]|nr:hypothetical protein [Ktedonobacteraceae bacterium]
SFSPSFTVKNGRRYRYYVVRDAMDYPGRKRQAPTRWPAKELEDVVLGRIHSFLLSPNELFDAYGNKDTTGHIGDWLTAARSLAERWPRLSPAEIQEFVNSCIAKILVNQGIVEVWLNQAAVSRRLTPSAPANTEALLPQTENAVLRLRVEAKLQRRGGELCLLLPTPGDQDKVRSRPNPCLVKAVVRAFRWSELLLQADAGNYASLAAKHGVGDRYFARVLPFAFLAPDIVESILEGTQPPSLTFAKMAQQIPLSWIEQRKRFGFPAFSRD